MLLLILIYFSIFLGKKYNFQVLFSAVSLFNYFFGQSEHLQSSHLHSPPVPQPQSEQE